MNAGSVRRRLVEEVDGAGETEIRILATQQGAWRGGKLLGDDDGGSRGFPGCGSILRIGNEGDLPCRRLLDSRYRGNFQLGIAVFQGYIQSGCNFAKLHRRQVGLGCLQNSRIRTAANHDVCPAAGQWIILTLT